MNQVDDNVDPENNQIESDYMPNDYLLWAILATCLCFPPTGIYALIKALRVESLWHGGYKDEAEMASEEALKWTKITAVIGIIIYIIIYFVGPSKILLHI